MNLCIDIGNSSTKVALFRHSELILHRTYVAFGIEDVVKLREEFEVKRAILSTVANLDEELLLFLSETTPLFLVLNPHTPLPIGNRYKTPHTLGNDRIAAAVGANCLCPDRPLLIIDSGSAITYDFVNGRNEFCGGNIAPGVEMRLKALHQYTKRLPLVAPPTTPFEEMLGTDTQSAIERGVICGVCHEIDGYISELKQIYPNLCTFLTGGNLNYFHNRLKNTTFVENFLVLIGLNRILEHNA